MRLDRLPAFDDEGRLTVVIEASAATRSKLKYKPEHGAFELHLVLPVGNSFPLDFGFIPSTAGEDGDPLDALVFSDEPVPAGMVVPSRVIGVVLATQAKPREKRVRNDRFLAVAAHSYQYGTWRTITDVPRAVLDQMETFFVSYNAQRGVDFRVEGRRGAQLAQRMLRRAAF